ncbi:cysteine desulfuration protein SufE [Pseudochelatococcus lubricantis]|uniref:Cysteine desulfuration protein SufE n=1 Tax=Pseudochelatococcus lubricantis TaxID=1538102 RepID=A0ABX0V0T6_9HYPH|nr:SufE family protein [Pseudochelatococcus lubricantis]NIJ57780.1 cysteine desulfuration protein SufE [Pseudochelatococcus lubricantis]
MQPPLEEILDNFAFLDDWDDRYRYLIELGRTLEPLPEDARTEDNKVRGCASQVWLQSSVVPDSRGGAPVLIFHGDSDAHIVRGLVALALAIFSGKRAAEIVRTDAFPVFDQLGLAAHLTPQRSNGLRSMVDRIRKDAQRVVAQSSPNAAATADSA